MNQLLQKKLLIIAQAQFGYHTPNYTYVKYLKEDFEITYICWDFNKKKIYVDGVNVIYVKRNGNFITRSMNFLKTILRISNQKNTVIFITYFKFISTILKVLERNNPIVLDIRTGSVKKKHFLRLFYDGLMRAESALFKYRTVLSVSLAKKIKLYPNVYILPLGADIISSTQKTFDEINLLYVGTLWNRNIEETIIGFSKFYHEYKEIIPIRYTIIGCGKYNEVQNLKEIVKKERLSEVVDVLGEIPHNRLKKHFDSHNIGVSYIPMTPYYDCQPAIKLFEYLLSGMPVIATDTFENRVVVNDSNGILINDNSSNFYKGLRELFERRQNFNSDYICNSSRQYSWMNIVDSFKGYLNHIYDEAF